MGLQVIFEPTSIHLLTIKDWLKKEWDQKGIGFYIKWDDIEDSSLRNELAVLVEEDIAIGFLCFKLGEKDVSINIAEIKPNKRRKGNLHFLVNSSKCYFKQKQKLVVDLFCEPKISSKAWEKVGFKYSPKHYLFDNKLRMYISLTETLNTTISNDKEEFIELWDFDPIQRSVDNPTWSWKIERKNNRNELIKPIIHPAHYDWQICWRKGKEIYVLNCVKYFKFQEIYWSSFIIICELPNL